MEHRSYLRQLRPHAKRNPNCRQHYNLQLACYRQLRGGAHTKPITVLPCLAEIKQGWEAEQMPGYRSTAHNNWPVYQVARSQPECRYKMGDSCAKNGAITYSKKEPRRTASKLRGIYRMIVFALIGVGAAVGAVTSVGALAGGAVGGAVGGGAGVASVSALVRWGDPRFGRQEPDCTKGADVLNQLFDALEDKNLGIVVSHHKYMAKKLIPLPKSRRKQVKRDVQDVTFPTKFQHMYDETICTGKKKDQKEGQEGQEDQEDKKGQGCQPEQQISTAYKAIRRRDLNDTEIPHVLQEMDKDGDRYISEAELVDWFSKKTGFANGCCIEVERAQEKGFICTCIYSNEKFRDRIEKYSYVRKDDTWTLDQYHNATWVGKTDKVLADGKKLWIIRHGNSLHNAPAKLKGSWKGLRFQKHVIDSSLTPIGMQQARVCGQALKDKRDKLPKDTATENIQYFASPLFRAQHTCALVRQAIEEPEKEPEKEAQEEKEAQKDHMECKEEPEAGPFSASSSFVDWCNWEACRRFWESDAATEVK
jgi:phosphohistidine phosphatase SixA